VNLKPVNRVNLREVADKNLRRGIEIAGEKRSISKWLPIGGKASQG
jgi:hypothetical protein